MITNNTHLMVTKYSEGNIISGYHSLPSFQIVHLNTGKCVCRPATHTHTIMNKHTNNNARTHTHKHTHTHTHTPFKSTGATSFSSCCMLTNTTLSSDTMGPRTLWLSRCTAVIMHLWEVQYMAEYTNMHVCVVNLPVF